MVCRRSNGSRALGTLAVLAALGGGVAAGGRADERGKAAAEMNALSDELAKVESALRVSSEVLAVLAERAASGPGADVAAAREQVQAAEKAYQVALEAASATQAEAKLRAAQQARDAKVLDLLKGAANFQAFRRADEALETEIAKLTARLSELSAAEVGRLAEARLAHRHRQRALYQACRATWTYEQVEPLYKQADQCYREHQGKLRRKEVAEARKALDAARRKLTELAGEKAAADEQCKWAAEQRQRLEAGREELRRKLAAARGKVLGGQQWPYEVPVPLPPRRGKAQDPPKAQLWIPPGCGFVRGLVMGHPPALGSGLTGDASIRLAAAEKGLGVICFRSFDALFNYTGDSPKQLGEILRQFAGKSGHPEVEHAPLLTIGHSTSGIYARNIAYWQPDRVIGIIHIKSGNMHQHCYDPKLTLAGVPFLAVNGEFEEYGPEGGIRSEYGRQTQWVMIREQLLRRRVKDPANLMSLVVHPGGTHGDWSRQLSEYCALFIRKAVDFRVPTDRPPAAGPVRCRQIKPQDGWLTDGDIKAPKHEPAPYGKYTGEKARAFWHFDEQMARATWDYHKDKFLLPDPSRDRPVPADWPGGPK